MVSRLYQSFYNLCVEKCVRFHENESQRMRASIVNHDSDVDSIRVGRLEAGEHKNEQEDASGEYTLPNEFDMKSTQRLSAKTRSMAWNTQDTQREHVQMTAPTALMYPSASVPSTDQPPSGLARDMPSHLPSPTRGRPEDHRVQSVSPAFFEPASPTASGTQSETRPVLSVTGQNPDARDATEMAVHLKAIAPRHSGPSRKRGRPPKSSLPGALAAKKPRTSAKENSKDTDELKLIVKLKLPPVLLASEQERLKHRVGASFPDDVQRTGSSFSAASTHECLGSSDVGRRGSQGVLGARVHSTTPTTPASTHPPSDVAITRTLDSHRSLKSATPSQPEKRDFAVHDLQNAANNSREQSVANGQITRPATEEKLGHCVPGGSSQNRDSVAMSPKSAVKPDYPAAAVQLHGVGSPATRASADRMHGDLPATHFRHVERPEVDRPQTTPIKIEDDCVPSEVNMLERAPLKVFWGDGKPPRVMTLEDISTVDDFFIELNRLRPSKLRQAGKIVEEIEIRISGSREIAEKVDCTMERDTGTAGFKMLRDALVNLRVKDLSAAQVLISVLWADV